MSHAYLKKYLSCSSMQCRRYDDRAHFVDRQNVRVLEDYVRLKNLLEGNESDNMKNNAALQKSIAETMKYLKRQYRAPAESVKGDPWHVLLFTVLSARSRDSQTEKVFQSLMRAYPTVRALSRATARQVEPYLKHIGLYHAKAKNVVALARELVEKYGGRVPDDLDKLIVLPGVGRKTANCTMIYAFGKPAMCVDTHVHRVTNRLGWVKTKTPEQTEFALRNIVPKKYWFDLNRVMVQFGRQTCGVRRCGKCQLCKWEK